MKRFSPGTKVEGGYYWNLSKWNIEAVSGEEGVLAGAAGDRYLRLPLLVMVPAALVMSFLFVVFLPFIGFAMVAYAAGRKLWQLGGAAMQEAAVAVAPGMRPGEAYFAGKPEERARGEQGTGDADPLEELQREIDKRRNEAREDDGR